MIFGGGRKVELVGGGGGGGSGVISSPSSSSATLAAAAASTFKSSANASLGTTAATAAAFASLSTSSFASPSVSYSASPQLIKREKRDTYGSYFTQQQQQRHGGTGAPQLSPLLMYSSEHRPHGQLEFDEFAQLALERFAVLQLFENVAARHMRGSNDYIQKLEKELHSLGFIKSVLCGAKDAIDEVDLGKDLLSHFILRLAFCQTEELKRWFIQQEVDMFRFKLHRCVNDSTLIERFLRDNDLNYVPISDEEKKSVMESLLALNPSVSQVSGQSYYKVHFGEVLELVKQRKCFVKHAMAYVTISDFGAVLTHVFRSRLSKSLTTLSRHIRELEEDERVRELLKILRERDVGGDNYANAKSRENISAESLDPLSLKAFPMCMRHLHESLKQRHHLRHYGRLQYMLFLKGIGLPLEESMRFWRGEFARGTTPPDKFDKEYAYNLRHSYGQEGKRTSYTPYSCLKIITGNMPGASDSHGCPFKHFEKDFLKQKLKQYGRTEDEISQLSEFVDSHNYQIACQRYFEQSHKTDELVPINHPNQYFEQSMRITGANGGGGARARVKTEHVKIEITQ